MKKFKLQHASFIENPASPENSGDYIVTRLLPDSKEVVVLKCPLCGDLVNIPIEYLFFGDGIAPFVSISTHSALKLGCCDSQVMIVMDVLTLYGVDTGKRKDVVKLLEEDL